MAEFVSDVAASVLGKLGSISYKEICLVWALKGELEELKKSMFIIKDVLLDAEEKQGHDKRISSWLTQLKDVFLDAEDVLDEFECEEQRKKSVKEHGSTCRKVRRFVSRSNPLFFSLNLAHTIKDVRERLNKLAEDCGRFGLTSRPEEKHKIGMNRRQVYSFIDDTMVIGREVDKEKIINLLIDQAANNSNDQQVVSVIPICGVAGMGKTTLTRLVRSDVTVDRWFEVKMWVSVSTDFDIPRLIKEMLDSATREKNDDLTDDQVQTRLRDCLKGRRFLLVLDDVWKVDRNDWEDLRSFLKGCSKGSKIIVTTRNEEVAKRMGAATLHQLKGLTDEDSLKLFLKCASEEGQDIKNGNLIRIAEEIIHDKCEGVPLSVITLGNLLYSNLKEQDWRRVKESEIWKLEEYKNKCFAPLLLSYQDLPFHLKRCFLYCSLFPKSKEIFSLELIHLWIAHGVLKVEKNDKRSLEDIGHKYFNELCSRSFFHHVKGHGWYYSFSMLNVIHDFALFVSRNECLIIKGPDADVRDRVRHLSIDHRQLGGGDEFPSCLKKLNGVRTILFPLLSKEAFITSFFNKYLIKNYKNLQMLDLSNSSFETLPSYVGRMKRLRSLNLSWNPKLTKLPGSISKLQSLQSLDLQGCSELEKLPRNIKDLSTSLVFLSITTQQDFFPENGIQCLTSLRTLMIVHCNEMLCLPDSMSCLTALKTLVISYCKNLSLFYEEHKNVGTLSLHKLILVELPRALALPKWLQGCKQSLQFLGLYDCPNLTEVPVWLPNAAWIQEIEIMQCPKLLSLPEGMDRLTSIVHFAIFQCPKLREYVEATSSEDWPYKISFEPEQQSRKESSSNGDLRRTENTWTEEENSKLIQTISEFYGKGKFKVEDNLKSGHLEAIRRLLAPKLPGSNLATKQIESQIKILKTSFRIVREMLTGPNRSDFGWDLEEKMVTAKEAVWDAYIQSHPEAKPFRDKAFPFYDELSIIFGKDDATMNGLDIVLADEVEESNERLGRKNSVGRDEEEEDAEDGIESKSFSEAPEIVPISSSDVLPMKKTENVGFGDIGEAIKEAALVIAGEIKDSTNRLKQGFSQEINEKFMRLNDELMKITTLTVTERLKATHLICQNIAIINIFFSLPDGEKEEWVRALIKGFT
ncbi:NB-ARC domain, LRR domain containing protein [Trema orientale]|uniref:NB-ARC domain, LRR domain containing protein n=1 Tax=Trema orientale TaxID=63057 RepID=A0A2P5EMU2_TREOI|nr:NB-ARC domain, LRR domain containing protein [Trema orientale]